MNREKDLNDQFRNVSSLLWELAGPRLPRLAIGLVLMMIDVSSLVAPASTRYLVDDVIGRRNPQLLLPLVLCVFGASLVQAGCTFGVTNIVSIEGHRLVAQLRRRLQRYISRLPVAYFDAHKAGVIASRVVADVEGTRNLMGYALVEYVGSIVTAIFSAIYLARINALLTLAVLLTGAMFAFVSRQRLRKIRPLVREGSRLHADLTGRLIESLNGIRVVKSYRAEEREAEVFSKGVDRQFDNGWTTSKTMTVTVAMGAVMVGGVTAGVTFLAAQQIFSGHLTLGGFMTFTAFVTFMMGPMAQLSGLTTQLSQAIAGLDRAGELLREKVEDDDPRRTKHLTDVRGQVSFENVSFEYQRGTPVLLNMSFHALPGTVTTLVGSSGSGKSTITSLIAAFYAPSQGLVRVDGNDLSKVDLASYRIHLGVVFQDTFLFDGTIRENICFARPDASPAEARRAAEIAHVHEFAARLPQGYETVVGERGIKLSGGQRQRISIARAILADPRILILDEATSSLDSESEGAIQQGLAYLMQGRTTFVIAHRLSTIHRADQVLVIEGGRIVEQGTHNSLYAANGRYRELYLRQQLGADLFLSADGSTPGNVPSSGEGASMTPR